MARLPSGEMVVCPIRVVPMRVLASSCWFGGVVVEMGAGRDGSMLRV